MTEETGMTKGKAEETTKPNLIVSVNPASLFKPKTKPKMKKPLVTAIAGSRTGLWIVVRESSVVKFENDPANAGYLNEIIRIVTRAVKKANSKHHMISKRLEITSEVYMEERLD